MASAKKVKVDRVIYKEITLGDRAKLVAKANKAASGGGARDFRFGSFDHLLPTIKLLFPIEVKQKRRRDGITVEVGIHTGKFHWIDAAKNEQSEDSAFEPPTTARAGEGRITKVHTYQAFAARPLPKHDEDDMLLLLLVQTSDNKVWPHFVRESSLRAKIGWNAQIADGIVDCIDAKRPANSAVIGFIDLVHAGNYCNGA